MDVERWALKNLNVRVWIVFVRLSGAKNEADALFCFLDRPDNGVEVRPIAGVEFGMEQFAIGANLESAAA